MADYEVISDFFQEAGLDLHLIREAVIERVAQARGALMRWDAVSACRHTPAPSGYLQWHEWAERMSRTHEQRQCQACGLWAVWVKRGTPPAPAPEHGPTDGTP